MAASNAACPIARASSTSAVEFFEQISNRASCRLPGPENEACSSRDGGNQERERGVAGSRNRTQGRPIGTFAEGPNSRRRNVDRTLSRDEPHPPNAAKAKSVLLRLLLGRDELDEFAAKRKESWRKNLN